MACTLRVRTRRQRVLELDLNYMARQPLFGADRMESQTVAPCAALCPLVRKIPDE